MARLFIIGNGFDLAHGLKTAYRDFRAFLSQDIQIEEFVFPSTYMDKDGEIIPDENSTKNLLINIIDEAQGPEWSDVEQALGTLRFEEFFERTPDDAVDDKDDDAMFHEAYNCEDMSSDLKLCVGHIQSLFKDWIDGIEIKAEQKIIFKGLYDENDLFLNFNYTNTLEEIYHINPKNICHIHGEQNSQIVFGHGNSDNPYQNTDLWFHNLKTLIDSLIKNTQDCLSKNHKFFDQIKKTKITDINCIGFSFSEVDLNYIEYIISLVEQNVIWHLSEYDEALGKNRYFERIIRENGFEGDFGDLIPII